jgi:hypothetical protein
MNQLRPELETLPQRMKALPVHSRGYPIPWFVATIDGEPDFRIGDRTKWVDAVKHRRCWVCGDFLGRHLAFVVGPMCGISRTASDPPAHRDCAEWSARNCPFLNLRQPERRENAVTAGCPMAGIGILRNPAVSLVWITTDYRVFKDGKGGLLLRMGEPEEVTFWHRGRPATRSEIEESIRSGIHNIEKVCSDSHELRMLNAARSQFEALLPTA